MRIAVLGTGVVGETIGTKLVALGHEVRMGSRTADNAKGTAWAEKHGAKASHGTFADAAAFGELVFLATSGSGTVAAVEAAGNRNLAGKVVVDITNPLDFSQGMPPTLSITGRDSLGEQVQRAAPDAKVVKSLNTVNAQLMVEPARLPGTHDMFVAGNDAGAKQQVRQVLTEWFGWKQVHDLGDVTAARGLESWLPLWVRLWGALGTADFNLHLVVKK